jgi:type VI secretion system ImpM family protein
MSEDSFPIGCFGKLPFHKEYIQANIHEPEAQHFLKWMDEGARYLKSFSGSSQNAYSQRYQLIFCPKKSAKFLTGHIRLSSDSLRSYPFAIFSTCNYKGFAGHFSLLPHLFAQFWDELRNFMSKPFADLQSFHAHLRELHIPIPPTPSKDKEEFLSITIGTKLNVLWNALFGTADDPRKLHILQNLWTVLSPYRKGSHHEIPIALRIPLSSKIIPPPVQIFFWLEVISRTLKRIDIAPSLFIPEPQEDATAQAFYIFFREPQPSDYRDIMENSEESEKINNLCGDWGFLEGAKDFPPKIKRLLASQETTLQQIIDSYGIE